MENSTEAKPSRTLRDELAMDRTRLANLRTLMAFVRTGLYFLVTGLALWKVEVLAALREVAIGFFFLSLIIIVIGLVNFVRQSRRMNRYYAMCET